MVSQALMPKRCNVLLETVKELPLLQVLKIKGDGLCHDRAVSRRLWSGLSVRAAVCLGAGYLALVSSAGQWRGKREMTQAPTVRF